MSNKKQELFALCEGLGSPPFLYYIVGSVLLIFSMFCYVVLWFFAMCVFVWCLVCQMLPVSLDCPFLIDKYFEDNNILGRYFDVLIYLILL